MKRYSLIILSILALVTKTSYASDSPPYLSKFSPDGEIVSFAEACTIFKGIDATFRAELIGIINRGHSMYRAELYNLTIQGQTIKSILFIDNRDKGNQLLAYLPMAKVPVDRFTAVANANLAFDTDMNQIETKLGIKFSSAPTTLINACCPNNALELLSIAMPCYSAQGHYNPKKPINDTLGVRIAKFLPDRSDYRDEVIYHAGDLYAALCNNKALFFRCQKRAMDNANNIAASLHAGLTLAFIHTQEDLKKWQHIVLCFDELDPIKQKLTIELFLCNKECNLCQNISLPDELIKLLIEHISAIERDNY